MTIALALLATLASACALNVGYLLEHRPVRGMRALSARRSRRSLLGISLAGGHAEGTGAAETTIAGRIAVSGLAATMAVRLLSPILSSGAADGTAPRACDSLVVGFFDHALLNRSERK
jgi:hypothetical protein